MRRSPLIIALAVLCAPPAASEPVRYLAARQIVLTFTTANSGPVDAAEVWLSADNGRTWQDQGRQDVARGAVRIAVPGDGPYGVYVVLSGAGGRSADPPAAGSEPHLRVIVDTAVPTLQLHAAAAGPDRTLTIRATLVDENLGPAGVRVFYRPGGTTAWEDGGTVPVETGLLRWTIPATAGDVIDLRAVATDLAGNQAVDELRGVALRGSGVTVPPATTSMPTPLDLDVASAPSTPAPTIRADPAAPENEQQLARLRAAAAQFMAQRRYPLAAARLEDALALAPADPDVLAELGGALYWAGQHDQAASRYQAALALRPDHLAALDGLALVAVTQKRYAEARAHLQRLLQLTPDSPILWLRYGDVEHRLGNTARALEAWRKLRSIPQADDATRQKAEKRLNYFDPVQRRSQSTHGKVE